MEKNILEKTADLSFTNFKPNEVSTQKSVKARQSNMDIFKIKQESNNRKEIRDNHSFFAQTDKRMKIFEPDFEKDVSKEGNFSSLFFMSTLSPQEFKEISAVQMIDFLNNNKDFFDEIEVSNKTMVTKPEEDKEYPIDNYRKRLSATKTKNDKRQYKSQQKKTQDVGFGQCKKCKGNDLKCQRNSCFCKIHVQANFQKSSKIVKNNKKETIDLLEHAVDEWKLLKRRNHPQLVLEESSDNGLQTLRFKGNLDKNGSGQLQKPEISKTNTKNFFESFEDYKIKKSNVDQKSAVVESLAFQPNHDNFCPSTSILDEPTETIRSKFWNNRKNSYHFDIQENQLEKLTHFKSHSNFDLRAENTPKELLNRSDKKMSYDWNNENHFISFERQSAQNSNADRVKLHTSSLEKHCNERCENISIWRGKILCGEQNSEWNFNENASNDLETDSLKVSNYFGPSGLVSTNRNDQLPVYLSNKNHHPAKKIDFSSDEDDIEREFEYQFEPSSQKQTQTQLEIESEVDNVLYDFERNLFNSPRFRYSSRNLLETTNDDSF